MMFMSPFAPKTVSVILFALAFLCILWGQTGLAAILLIFSAVIWVNNPDDYDDDDFASG